MRVAPITWDDCPNYYTEGERFVEVWVGESIETFIPLPDDTIEAVMAYLSEKESIGIVHSIVADLVSVEFRCSQNANRVVDTVIVPELERIIREGVECAR